MRLWRKLPDDILHMACGTVSFAISFGQHLKNPAGAGLEERLMSFKGIADYPPTDYDDTGRDGLKDWPRIKQLIAA
jgi:hypothetical protein